MRGVDGVPGSGFFSAGGGFFAAVSISSLFRFRSASFAAKRFYEMIFSKCRGGSKERGKERGREERKRRRRRKKRWYGTVLWAAVPRWVSHSASVLMTMAHVVHTS